MKKEEAKEKLKFLETLPWYLAEDGMPLPVIIYLGIFLAYPSIKIYRYFRKKYLKAQIESKSMWEVFGFTD